MSDCTDQILLKQNKSICDENVPESVFSLQQNPVTFLTKADIIPFIQQKCKEIAKMLNTHEDEALILLNHYNWRIESLKNDWFEDEDQLRKEVGIKSKQAAKMKNTPEALCKKCYKMKPRAEFDSIACNHLICKDCWTDYIQSNVSRSENAFFWRCPVEGCNLVVPDSFNKKYISYKNMVQYEKKKVMTYIQNSKTFKLCSIPHCQYGFDITGNEFAAVECLCGYIYSTNCGLEDHRPLWDCKSAADWLEKCKEWDGCCPLEGEIDIYIHGFLRCETEQDSFDEFKLRKLQYSESMIDMIRRVYTTLRDAKRLEKWSYAYAAFLTRGLGSNLPWKYDIQHQKFAKYSRQLQKLLEDYLEEKDCSRYEQYKELIQIAESNCKKASSIYFDEVMSQVKNQLTFLEKPENKYPTEERLHIWGDIARAIVVLMIMYLGFLTHLFRQRY